MKPSSDRAALWSLAALAGFPALLPFARSAELAILLSLILLPWLWRRGDLAGQRRAIVGFVALWACYALPAALSSLDSADPGRSWETTLSSLRFLGLGVVAIVCAARPDVAARLPLAVSMIVGLWLIDGLVQASTGFGLRGVSAPDRLTAIFGAEDLKLGLVLVVLAPIALIAAFGRSKVLGLLMLLATSIVLLLAGARASWISFALMLALLIHQASARRWRRTLSAYAVVAALLSGGTLMLMHASPTFNDRVTRTLAALQGDRTGLDFALAHRLPIFETAGNMIVAHPINGVGVRAFQAAYREHVARSDDIWLLMGDGRGAAHAHQIVLEVLSETGLIGLIGWSIGVWLLWRSWRDAAPDRRRRAWPYVMALMLMCFPFNTHLAFYSSYWGGVFFWLLALSHAMLRTEEKPA